MPPDAVLPTSELRRRLRDVLARLDASGEPVVIGHYRRPAAVLARYDDYVALVAQVGADDPHVTRRPDIAGGEPLVRGSRVPVRAIVERTQSGQTVEDILAALPHLTAADIHAALAYYYDHRTEMDECLAAAGPEAALAAAGFGARPLSDGLAVAEPLTRG